MTSGLYVWQVLEEGEWGVIGGLTLELGMLPLVTRDVSIARGFMRGVAEQHHLRTRLPVRLAYMTLADVLETME